MPRLLATLTTAAVAVLLLPAPVAQAAPAPVVSPSTVPRGGSFTVSGTGCWDPEHDPYTEGRRAWYVVVTAAPAGATSYHSADGYAQTDEWHDGNWSTGLRLVDAAGPGTYVVRARCSLGDVEFDYPAVALTVVGAPDPPQWWEPGGSGPPGQPKGPSAAAPPAAPAPPATGAPRAPAPPPAGAAPGAPAPATGAPSSATATGAAPGCADCARLPGGRFAPGDALRLAYTGFRSGEQVTVVLRSAPVTLGTFTADGTGTVTADVTLPADAETGSHTLTFSGATSGDLVVLPLELAAAAAAASSSAPAVAARSARPGSAALLITGAAAAALLLTGAGLAVVDRRRTARRRTAVSGDADADRGTHEVRDPGGGRAEDQLA
ncbi:hypothetical protein [Blastococcus sp. TF02A-30]|uniref:hypothetical protein n=1 Tax=Blastococcus sp. TF02A-30 TaxID=2250580 RepID=UPI000DEA8527|nr:hypothetical protein [Blastococcus sp. TF02A-30]RBY86277.1 hypothetical protein DQ241_11955 [Blastococcus sp. TF02A-30]